MRDRDYKYIEHYKRNKILIHGTGGEWWWTILTETGHKKNSVKSYYSIESAVHHAKKIIEKK